MSLDQLSPFDPSAIGKRGIRGISKETTKGPNCSLVQGITEETLIMYSGLINGAVLKIRSLLRD